MADIIELHAEAEEENCYLALFGQCRTRSPTMTTSARRYGQQVSTPPAVPRVRHLRMASIAARQPGLARPFKELRGLTRWA